MRQDVTEHYTKCVTGWKNDSLPSFTIEASSNRAACAALQQPEESDHQLYGKKPAGKNLRLGVEAFTTGFCPARGLTAKQLLMVARKVNPKRQQRDQRDDEENLQGECGQLHHE